MRHQYALIIPALDEAENIGALLRQIPSKLFCQVLVVDNGSRDQTAEVARGAGAEVIFEPRRGYGQACSSGLERLHFQATAILFMDADLSDDPKDLEELVRFFESDRWDLVVGSRVLGRAERGSLTPVQRCGNWLATRLIALIWRTHFTDLGPLRVLRRSTLEHLKLRDRTFGWNVEMQSRAAQLQLKVCEVPVHYQRRPRGHSKISGTLAGSWRAGVKILWTIFRCWLEPFEARTLDP